MEATPPVRHSGLLTGAAVVPSACAAPRGHRQPFSQRPEIACAACHGEKLTGTDVVPGIAGRSPSYIFRQLYEYQHGFRAGPESKPMVEVVNGLKEADLLALAANLGTLER